MAHDQPAVAGDQDTEVGDKQPSSPALSTSSREETRDARERLKKTSIAGLKQHSATAMPASTSETLSKQDTLERSNEMNNGSRGRPAKKRSFEDLAKDDIETDATNSVGKPPEPKSGHHKRMRSRDVASGDNLQAYNTIEGNMNTTLHEETDADARMSPGGPGVLVDASTQEDIEKDPAAQPAQSETQKSLRNRPQDTTAESPATQSLQNNKENQSQLDTTTADQLPPSSMRKPEPGSGFANASSASPFGAIKSSSKETTSAEPPKPASGSAFASSGLSAFASSDKSPFGAAVGAKSPGGFGSATATGGFGSTKSGFGSATGFGSASTSSTFAGGSGFASSKGFGSAAPGSSFGAPKPFGASSGFGTGSTSSVFGSGKPFASSKKESRDDDDEEEAAIEEDEEATSNANDNAEQDPRFHEQHVDTGEEDERTHFSSRARLYFFSKEGGWKERGTGVFKINIKADDAVTDSSDVEAQAAIDKRKARLLMRADATHRVILNSPVFKGMKFGNPDGSEPTGKLMHLQSLEDGKPLPLQIKIGKEEVLKELYHALKELEQEA